MSNVSWADNGHPYSIQFRHQKSSVIRRQYFYEFREGKTWSNVFISWKAPFIIIYIENKHNVKNIFVILWIIIDYDSVSNFSNTKEFIMITNIFPNLGSDVDIADTDQKRQIKKTRQIWLTNSRPQKKLESWCIHFSNANCQRKGVQEKSRKCSIINTSNEESVCVSIFSI